MNSCYEGCYVMWNLLCKYFSCSNDILHIFSSPKWNDAARLLLILATGQELCVTRRSMFISVAFVRKVCSVCWCVCCLHLTTEAITPGVCVRGWYVARWDKLVCVCVCVWRSEMRQGCEWARVGRRTVCLSQCLCACLSQNIRTTHRWGKQHRLAYNSGIPQGLG